MRVVAILVLGFLVGCTGQPSLEELEDAAVATGDWSKVEKRERVVLLRQGPSRPACSFSHTRVCVENGVTTKCNCYKPSLDSR